MAVIMDRERLTSALSLTAQAVDESVPAAPTVTAVVCYNIAQS